MKMTIAVAVTIGIVCWCLGYWMGMTDTIEYYERDVTKIERNALTIR